MKPDLRYSSTIYYIEYDKKTSFSFNGYLIILFVRFRNIRLRKEFYLAAIFYRYGIIVGLLRYSDRGYKIIETKIVFSTPYAFIYCIRFELSDWPIKSV